MWDRVDERVERLIVRHLDRELTAEETVEFEAEMLRSPAARALLHEYTDIDRRSRDALQTVLVRPMAAAAPRRAFGGFRLATAIGVAAAAAAIGLFVFPHRSGGGFASRSNGGWPAQGTRPVNIQPLDPASAGAQPQFVVDEGLSGVDAWQRMTPQRRVTDLRRDYVTVYDPATQRYFVVEVDRGQSRSAAVRFEY